MNLYCSIPKGQLFLRIFSVSLEKVVIFAPLFIIKTSSKIFVHLCIFFSWVLDFQLHLQVFADCPSVRPTGKTFQFCVCEVDEDDGRKENCEDVMRHAV